MSTHGLAARLHTILYGDIPEELWMREEQGVIVQKVITEAITWFRERLSRERVADAISGPDQYPSGTDYKKADAVLALLEEKSLRRDCPACQQESYHAGRAMFPGHTCGEGPK